MPIENYFNYDSEDISLVLETLNSFAEKELEPVFGTPENVLSGSELARLLDKFRELGILGEGEIGGLALWEAPRAAEGIKFSLKILRIIARINAGLAFSLHQLALGAYAGALFTPASNEDNLLFLPHGTAKGVLALWLRGVVPEGDNLALVRDYFSASPYDDKPLYLQGPEEWKYLFIPKLSSDGNCLNWLRFDRKNLTLRSVDNPHGLNESMLWEISCPLAGGEEMLPENAEEGAGYFMEFSVINSLALIAIGLGGLEKSYRVSRKYAGERIQGGASIEKHAAIRLLLGNIRSSIESVSAFLETDMDVEKGITSLVLAFALRSVSHPLLCAAASDAVQLHGGYGYMRDVGMEKILRDNNQLKLSYGTPDELKLFIALAEERDEN